MLTSFLKAQVVRPRYFSNFGPLLDSTASTSTPTSSDSSKTENIKSTTSAEPVKTSEKTEIKEAAALTDTEKEKIPASRSSEPSQVEIINAAVPLYKGYKPKVLSDLTIRKDIERPLPLNAKLIYHEPLKIKIPNEKNIIAAEIIFKAHVVKNVEFISNFALRVGFFLGISLRPVRLAKKTKLWTLNKSPFAQNSSKENFHSVTHTRAIRAYNANPEIIELWLAYLQKEALFGVHYKANIFTYHTPESLNEAARVAGSLMDEENDVAKRVKELLADPAFKTILDEEKEKTKGRKRNIRSASKDSK